MQTDQEILLNRKNSEINDAIRFGREGVRIASPTIAKFPPHIVASLISSLVTYDAFRDDEGEADHSWGVFLVEFGEEGWIHIEFQIDEGPCCHCQRTSRLLYVYSERDEPLDFSVGFKF